MTKLNLKQQAFVDEYIKTGTAYQSAIKAGYSEKYAKSSSHKLLENVGIKSYTPSHSPAGGSLSIPEQLSG